MNEKMVIDKTKDFVRAKLEGEGSGHDWWHIVRVYNTAKYIGEKENADLFIVELAALLHDIADWKFHKDNVNLGSEITEQWLKSLEVPEDKIQQVTQIIKTLSFKGGTVDSTQHSIEGKVVQDADRLDAIGAIGIARTFAYGGFINREMYNPEKKPQSYNNFEEYKNAEDTTINHFYEKLLLLKDLMNTEAAKNMAVERHEYMENFLNEFYSEWEGLK
jgi:uncharacterized protein